MRKNVGKIDKIIRLVIGIPLTAWGIYAKSWWALLGIVIIITAIIAKCTVYDWFKINTR